MLRAMTDEEIEDKNKRLEELRSGSFKEQIMAILMDTNIGGSGTYEKSASMKVDVILKYIDNYICHDIKED